MLIRFFQLLPEFKGKTRICRWLLRSYIKQKTGVIINANDGLRFRIPNFSEPIGFSILINGAHETQTSKFIIDQVPQGGVFMDIGANIGAITLPVCKKRRDIKAVCIEASFKVFGYLSDNVKMNNLDNCVLVNKAISDINGQKVSFYSPPDQHGKGSLSPVFTDESESVITTTLEALLGEYSIESVDFIKVDIEGYEYYAFKGAENSLRKLKAPVILFEFIDWAEGHAKDLKPGDAQRLLMDYGYFIYLFEDGQVKGEPLKCPITNQGLYMLFATKVKVSV